MRRLDLSAGGLWPMVYGDLADDYECCVTMAAMLYFVAPRFLRHLSVSPITTSILMSLFKSDFDFMIVNESLDNCCTSADVISTTWLSIALSAGTNLPQGVTGRICMRT